MIIQTSPRELPSLPLHSPAQPCCNCGAQRQLAMAPVKLKITRYFLFAGTETTLTLMLPFCQRCKGTASRMRQGLFSRLLIALMLFFPLLMWIVFASPKMSLLKDHPVLAPLLLCVVLVEGFYALRRPGPKQTSAFQPVYLRTAERASDGEILSLALRCTNRAFAGKFREANKDACDQGWLKIEND